MFKWASACKAQVGIYTYGAQLVQIPTVRAAEPVHCAEVVEVTEYTPGKVTLMVETFPANGWPSLVQLNVPPAELLSVTVNCDAFPLVLHAKLLIDRLGLALTVSVALAEQSGRAVAPELDLNVTTLL